MRNIALPMWPREPIIIHDARVSCMRRSGAGCGEGIRQASRQEKRLPGDSVRRRAGSHHLKANQKINQQPHPLACSQRMMLFDHSKVGGNSSRPHRRPKRRTGARTFLGREESWNGEREGRYRQRFQKMAFGQSDTGRIRSTENVRIGSMRAYCVCYG